MDFDWDAATITVKVPVQHTAMKETQDITLPLPQFATMLLDLHSRHVRQQMAKQAVQRRQSLGDPRQEERITKEHDDSARGGTSEIGVDLQSSASKGKGLSDG